MPKIDEFRHIARSIGISESKSDDSVLTLKIHINGYDLFCCDKNKHGGGVACYIRDEIRYNIKTSFPKDLENIFFESLLPNTYPIVVGTIYHSPNQTNFMKIFNETLSKVDINNVKTYILGDLNKYLWQNGQYVFQKHSFLSCQSVQNYVENYFDFYTIFSL